MKENTVGFGKRK